MGWRRMNASSSAAVAQTGSSSGSSRFLPATFEPICATQAQHPHRMTKLVRGLLRRLHGQRRNRKKALGASLRQLGELLVLNASKRRRQRRRLRIDEGLRADREYLNV